MSVQALGPELAIEGFDEAVVRRLARPGKVQNNALLIGPQIEVAGDELAAIVDPDRLGIANRPAGTLQGLHYILSLVVEPWINHRRET